MTLWVSLPIEQSEVVAMVRQRVDMLLRTATAEFDLDVPETQSLDKPNPGLSLYLEAKILGVEIGHS